MQEWLYSSMVRLLLGLAFLYIQGTFQVFYENKTFDGRFGGNFKKPFFKILLQISYFFPFSAFKCEKR